MSKGPLYVGQRVTLLTWQSSEAGYLAVFGEAVRQHEGVDVNALTLVELSARTGLTTKLLGHARQELKRN